MVVPCEAAGEEGLAVRVWRPAVPRYEEVAPVVVRTGGLGSTGFQISLEQDDARAQGVVVVQHLPPGQSALDLSSGGTDDRFGANWNAGLACALAYARDGITEVAPEATGPRVATGLSLSGGNLLNVLDEEPTLAEGAVLWESPLVDQLVLSELTPGGTTDPLFTPGSCTLDGGCPIPGRAEELAWSDADGGPFEDRDGDGAVSEGETVYRGMSDPSVGDKPEFFSTELHEDATAIAQVEWWPTVEETAAFWAPRDAGAALRAIRDDGDGHAFVFVARAEDHVQQLHEHVRLAQEGLLGAEFFRLNPDAAYAPNPQEIDAGTVLTGADLSDRLPTAAWEELVLGAELELADRLWTGTWDADLEDPIVEFTK